MNYQALRDGLVALISDAQRVISEIDALSVIDNVKRLAIPWMPQNDPKSSTDDFSNSDCGPACVTMILRWLGQGVTLDDVSRATGLAAGYKYTVAANLIRAAQHFGLTLKHEFGDLSAPVGTLTLDKIKQEIDAGRPSIALVHYPSLPKRSDQSYRGDHYVLVVGYNVDTGDVFYHDPYWRDSTGECIEIGGIEFAKAQSDCAINGNRGFQGLTIKP